MILETADYLNEYEILKVWGYVSADDDIRIISNEDPVEKQLREFNEATGNITYIPAGDLDYLVIHNPIWLNTVFSNTFSGYWFEKLNCCTGWIGGTQWVLIPTLIIKREYMQSLTEGIPQNKLAEESDVIPGGCHRNRWPSKDWSPKYLEEGTTIKTDYLEYFLGNKLEPRSLQFKPIKEDYLGVMLWPSNMSVFDIPGKDWGFIDECNIKEVTEAVLESAID